MKTNPDDEAFSMAAYGPMGEIALAKGLTKKELFSAMAMHGLAHQTTEQCYGLLETEIAKQAVILADALIAALNEGENE